MKHLCYMLRLTAKLLLILFSVITALLFYYYGFPFNECSVYSHKLPTDNASIDIKKINEHAKEAKAYCDKKGFNDAICFMIDMGIPSGRNRFFICDLRNNSLLCAGLAAHGSCNNSYLLNAKFSNEKGCGCTALGKYKIGYKYAGRFGTAYKLYGLDTSNSNAFDRCIVLHSYYLVPDKEVYPMPICNSLGCAMVSANFLETLSNYIDSSRKPVLLWIFD